MNSGLYALAGASATATAAACANRLLEPMTKVSKRYLGFSLPASPSLTGVSEAPPGCLGLPSSTRCPPKADSGRESGTWRGPSPGPAAAWRPEKGSCGDCAGWLGGGIGPGDCG